MSRHERIVEMWTAGPPLWEPSFNQDPPSLTPYPAVAEDGRPTPAVIVFPGGGYGAKAAHEGEPVARRLNDAGITAFVVDYRVAPYRHPVPLLDARRAVQTVRSRAEEWKVDRQRIGVLGFSAGGHLCATLSTRYVSPADAGPPSDRVDAESARPDFAVLAYPVISFAEYGHTGSMKNLLGPEPGWHERRALSAELQVSPQTPPTFLWHTADDPVVPAENSLRYAAALRSSDVEVELHIFPHGQHGLGLAPQTPRVARWMDLCIEWIGELESPSR